jgi:hypothetical protein
MKILYCAQFVLAFLLVAFYLASDVSIAMATWRRPMSLAADYLSPLLHPKSPSPRPWQVWWQQVARGLVTNFE